MTFDNRIVVFSHLRWDFVYQRPQQIMSRLAHAGPIVYIEEPIYDPEQAPHWERSSPHPGVEVYRPHTPVQAPGYSEAQLPAIEPLLGEVMAGGPDERPVAWLYTPMALPLARAIRPRPEVVVYDCMDELSAFDFAPPELLEREAELLEWADIVFTGGPSLYQAKRDRHPNVHCFPSSVDAAHFGQVRQGRTEPADQVQLPHPRLGFFGVIDERMDRELLGQLADAHPDWQIVMVGPVVKIDPNSLPQRPNVHYLGMRSYQELPAYLSGWDVCLLPFARNRSTRFISPTKTLEYMAAGKPIVSTPITDVAEPYGQIVYLGDTPQAFVCACGQALAADEAERERRQAMMLEVVEQTSWDRTVRAMAALIAEARAVA
jgi:UDP-galactopyranose mutase